MGEIGINRSDFLYKMAFWEINAVVKGYNRRQYQEWSMARWHAFQIMSAMPYCDLKKAGIYRPTDLLRLPGDKEGSEQISKDDAAELKNLMAKLNKQKKEQLHRP